MTSSDAMFDTESAAARVSDWKRRWKEATLASGTGGATYEDESRALKYARSKRIRADGKRRAARLPLHREWSVLDIGSGPGTLTVPLAKRVRTVTAVDPSAPMLRLLQARAKAEGVANIRTIHSNWESVVLDEPKFRCGAGTEVEIEIESESKSETGRTESEIGTTTGTESEYSNMRGRGAGDETAKRIGRFDIVIASYSLAMTDIEAALLNMNAVARKRVYLYWFAGVPTWEHTSLELYPQIHGSAYTPMPKCDLLFNILYAHGLYPDIEILDRTSFPRDYRTLTAAVDDLKQRLGVVGDAHDAHIERYVRDHLRRSDGGLVWDDETVYVRLTWTPQQR